MSDRDLQHLRTVVGNLQRRIETLEMRVGALADGVSTALPGDDDLAVSDGFAPPAEGTDSGQDMRPAAVRAFFLLGRSILVLAGGFLLRALTGGGALPPMIGFAAGVAYSLVLITFADLSGRRGDRAGAGSLGVTAALVAYPFLAEAIARLHLVSPVIGALGWILVTGAGLLAAAHVRHRLVAWAFSLASLGTAVLLSFATGQPLLYGWLLLGLGAATLFLAYEREWRLKRWFVAITVDALVLRMVLIASNPGEPAAGAGGALVLALAMLVVYLGIFTYRSAVLGKGVRAFYILQSLAVLAIGYGGAVRLALAMGKGAALLGIAALIAAVAYYTVAFTIVGQRHGRGRAFFWFASLALAFLVLGSRVVAGGVWLPWCWAALGLTATILGGQFNRMTLRAHGVIYLALAALNSGMAAAAWSAFLGGTDSAWPVPGPDGLTAWLVAAVCWHLQVRAKNGGTLAGANRIPRFGAALFALLGLGWGAVSLLVLAVGGLPPEGAGQSAVAVVRTGVLSGTVIALALASRRPRWGELGWPVYPFLALGCVKLLIEDLRRGTPLTLTIAFALFGTALILAPRLMLAGRKIKAADG